ncbi:hypothetical protein DFH06DRAFT_1333720 [Mycena polygramma]|nr:hypothetical protein DFH06DRAFT_1333720 [Mycena polygramma]
MRFQDFLSTQNISDILSASLALTLEQLKLVDTDVDLRWRGQSFVVLVVSRLSLNSSCPLQLPHIRCFHCGRIRRHVVHHSVDQRSMLQMAPTPVAYSDNKQLARLISLTPVSSLFRSHLCRARQRPSAAFTLQGSRLSGHGWNTVAPLVRLAANAVQPTNVTNVIHQTVVGQKTQQSFCATSIGVDSRVLTETFCSMVLREPASRAVDLPDSLLAVAVPSAGQGGNPTTLLSV